MQGMNTTSIPPRLGRCKHKGCDYALFVAPGQEVEAESFRDVKGDGRAYRVGNEGYFARCPNNHKFFVLKQIKGTYSPDHKCDARCLNAKGPECTCSCGGANHGAGHAVTVVEASVAPVQANPVQDEYEPISERQEPFLRALLNGREIPDTLSAVVGGEPLAGSARREVALRKLDNGEFTKKQATATIGWLKTLPYRNNNQEN
jgi:hypothetical protein